MKLEDLQPNTVVHGLLPDGVANVVNVQWHGSEALTLVYRGPTGRVADEIAAKRSTQAIRLDRDCGQHSLGVGHSEPQYDDGIPEPRTAPDEVAARERRTRQAIAEKL